MDLIVKTFSIQIVAHYLKYKEDFLNIIQVKKQFQYVLNRFGINPIPITEETKNYQRELNMIGNVSGNVNHYLIKQKKEFQLNALKKWKQN